MKNDLTATNENTIYVVYDEKRQEEVLATECLEIAKSMVFNDSGLAYSVYPPYGYAPNKSEVDPWQNSYLEY